MRVFLLALLWLGCGAPQPEHWRHALQPAPAEPLRSNMELSLLSDPLKMGIVSQGGIATDGSSLRMEWRGAMGPTTLRWLMTDGQWTIQLPKEQVNIVASDAELVLRQLTDSAVGLSGFHQLLMGRFSWLPDAAREELNTLRDTQARVSLGRGVTAVLVLDEARERIARFAVENTAGEVLLSIKYRRFAQGRPISILVEIPRFKLTMTVDLPGWEPFTPTDTTFHLPTRAPFETLEMEKVWPRMLERLLQESGP